MRIKSYDAKNFGPIPILRGNTEETLRKLLGTPARIPLRDVLPHEFFKNFMESRAAKLLDVPVVETFRSYITPWPGTHKNVHIWWRLANGKSVGWNESPARGWSFPVITHRK